METSYRLPKKKYDYWTVVGSMVLFGGIFAFTMVVAFVASMRDKWVFNHMTDAQHLWEAKKSTPELGDVYLALRHLGAISPGSPEARESKGVEATVRQKESELSAAESERKAAQAKNAQAANDAREARAASVKQFESALKNIGYDLSVEASDDSHSEVVITSQEFSETDRRIRFLSVLREKWTPAALVCLQGFSRVRLKSSKIPMVGFSESYTLDCN